MDVKVFTFPLFLIWLFPEESQQGANELRLLHFLFRERYYNPLERPVANESLPIRINFTMILQQIIDVDEKNQIINTNSWLQMTWIADNLKWDPHEFGGITSIRVPAKDIWNPDILLYNSADEKFDGTYHANIIVHYDGSCLWIPPGMFKSTCSIDISWFPFDDQMCNMKFGSWTHDGRYLDLQMEDENGADVSNFIRNGEWDLIGVPAQRNVRSYVCCPEFYIDIVYTIHIRRRTLYYGFNIIIPCLLISTMSLLLFLLPSDAGEKISLDVAAQRMYISGVTILLSLMVFLLLVAETMPPTSDAVPLIGIYFCCIMVMCALSLLLFSGIYFCCIMVMCALSLLFTVVVLNFHHRGPETHKLPVWVKKGLNGWLASKLWLERPGMEKRRQSMIHRQRLGDIQLHDRTSHALLPNLLETEEQHRTRAENGMCGITAQTDDWIRPPTSQNQLYQQSPGGYNSKQSETDLLNHDLVAIHREVKKITSKIKQNDEDEHIKSEWKFAALVIDRLCLWVCLTATFVSTVAILVSAPHLIA